MRQFVLSTPPTSGTATVGGRDAHYLNTVLRLDAGDTFHAIDHSGQRYTCTITGTSSDECTFTAAELSGMPDPRDDQPIPRLTLYQCIPKGKRMDTVVRQAVEAGVSAIIPVLSERTIPRYKESELEGKRQRWVRVAREAVQQCGRTTIPEISIPTPLAAIPEPDGVGICFHETPLENGSLHEYLSDNPSNVSIIIGPEGGLTSGERDILSDAGYRFCWLGPNILRADTAALYAAAAVITIILERNTWRKPY